MIHEERHRSGVLVPALSTDAAKVLYPVLEIPAADGADGKSTEIACAIFKEAVLYAHFSPEQEVLYEAYLYCARLLLAPREAEQAVYWLRNAYTGDRRDNPNMLWGSIISHYANSDGGWPDMGQTQTDQEQIDAFAAFFLREWNHAGFQKKLWPVEDRFESADPSLSAWDKKILKKYITPAFEEDTKVSREIFLPLVLVNKGQALRRAIRKFDLAAKPRFPHKLLRRMGQAWIDKNRLSMPSHDLGALLDLV